MSKHLPRSSVVIAIPVKDEAERIANCLHALAFQSVSAPYQVVLLLNNCTDDTATVVRGIGSRLPMPVHHFEVTLRSPHANAGYARRMAMQAAEDFVTPHGVLLTTDADACVYPDWISANLFALRKADAVAGCVEIDPVEAALIPSRLHEDDAREREYADLLDEISARLDWDPADPWPRHSEHSGASIAVTLDAYRRVGGIPAVPLAEDRAFFDALRRVDARIRHTSAARVVVSGRIHGRATGGMADTIRRRIGRPDDMLDDALEPAFDAARRARIRKLARVAWSFRDNCERLVPMLSQTLMISPAEARKALSLPHFGEAWEEIERRCPSLVKQRVLVSELAFETGRARAILRDLLRKPSGVSSFVPADQGDIPFRDAEVAD